MWDASVADGSLTHYTTMVVPGLQYLKPDAVLCAKAEQEQIQNAELDANFFKCVFQ